MSYYIRIPVNGDDMKKKDDEFMKLKELIDSKKDFLIKKQKKLRMIEKQNEYLKDIKNDYLKYNKRIISDKRDQITALENLHSYINKLVKDSNLTKHNIRDAKLEQDKILKELDSLKNNLDDMIDDTQDISNILNVSRNK